MGIRSWLVHRKQDDVVAFSDEGEVRAGEMLVRSSALAAELRRRACTRVLLHSESSWSAAVAIAAAWSAGATVLLAPNGQAGTLAELAEQTDLLLCDAERATLRSLAILGPHPRPTSASVEFEDEAQLLVLCTSGSSGRRKLVAKTPRQLFDEVDALETAFGRGIGDACVLAGVSHQHMYGLLFRVLWPLEHGRAFLDRSAVEPGVLEARSAAPGRFILIGTPSWLERLHELFDLTRLRGRCSAIFCSGGPLEQRAALRFHAVLGAAPIEVFGSTETGGVAWRQRDASVASETWSTFPKTRIDVEDGGLVVVSSNTRGVPLSTGDRIELLAPDRFRLLGREDRIVKLFEERVSLSEIESRLGASAWVAASSAVVIERGGTERIGVALELSAAGLESLRTSGRAPLSASLRNELAAYFKPAVLPRAWRIVERLPRDEQGKLAIERVTALFAAELEHALPNVVAEPLRTPAGLGVEFEVPAELWCLRGHFDGHPVVPGVVQLQWVMSWARDWLGRELRPRVIQALKYKQLLRPAVRARADLELEGESLGFRIWNSEAEFSSGRILLGRRDGRSGSAS